MSQESIKISWIPLNEYYEQWSFLGSDNAYRVAEQIGAIDYLFDLKEQLPNYSLIQSFHERVILISLGALFEFGLKKAATHKILVAKDREPIIATLNLDKEEKKLEEEGMEGTINRLSRAGLINDDWQEFLHKVRELRDEVHMDKERDENIQIWVKNVGLINLRKRLEDFREVLRAIFQS